MIREYSKNNFSERRTYTSDPNGQIQIRIERDAEVRPVSPVRPVTPTVHESDFTYTYLRPDVNAKKTLRDTIPVERIRIPRPKSTNVPLKAEPAPDYDNVEFEDRMSNEDEGIYSRTASAATSFGTNRTDGSSPELLLLSTPVPNMKRIIRKSRLVSIHDGRPVMAIFLVNNFFYKSI